MDPSGVNWLPSLVVVGLALSLGGAIAWRLAAAGRGRPAPAAGPALEIRDLVGKRDALFQQLRELEDTAAKRDPDQLQRERYLLELAAARVLQQLGERAEAATRGERKPAPAASAPATAAPAAPSTWRGFLWGVGTATAIAALFLLVDRSARPRDAGGQLTGDIGPTGGAARPEAAPSEAQAAEAQARAALQRNPEDLEARLDLARALLARDDLMAVWTETQSVLQRSPGNARALSYQAMVRLGMGQVDQAVQMLKQAQAAEPTLIEPFVYIVAVYLQAGRAQEAEAAIAEAARRFPARAEGLNRLFAQMRGGVAAASAPGVAPSPQRAAGGVGISGVVDAEAGIKGSIAPGSIVFVTVRDADFGAGPPIAAKRLVASSLPVPFEITPADAMMGGELPARMLVEARIDSDGDPLTRPPTDPRARVEDVAAGSSDVRLIVKRP